jgi:phosphoglycerate dehydrogenase-like enzyme
LVARFSIYCVQSIYKMEKVKILVVGKPELSEYLGDLPPNAVVLDIGVEFTAFKDEHVQEAEVLLLRGGHDLMVAAFEHLYPKLVAGKLKWVHCCSAGIDFLFHSAAGEEFANNETVGLTNARGCYSQSLAEYCMYACLYFSKLTTRLQSNHEGKVWDCFVMPQLKSQTLCILGYGDIGSKVATLAKAFQMKVWGLRSRPEKSKDDPLLDKLFGPSDQEVHELVSNADFLVVCLPSTEATAGFVDRNILEKMKSTSVLINIGRGATLNEDHLFKHLEERRIFGAALDVFKTEPLPKSSSLWNLPNDVLLMSSHNADNVPNMDQLALGKFREILQEFVDSDCKVPSERAVNKKLGY